jgi:hypothetical protein
MRRSFYLTGLTLSNHERQVHVVRGRRAAERRHTPISNQTTRAAEAKEQAEAERSANKPESQPRTDGFGALVSALR